MADALVLRASSAPASDESFAPAKRRDWLFRISVVWLAIVGVCAAAADVLPLRDPHLATIDTFLSPSLAHPFGTDGSGHDLFSRTIYGGRVSIIVAIASVAAGIIVGGTMGMTAGFLRGKVGGLLMWLTDVLLAFPALVFILAVVSFAGATLSTVVTVIAVLAIPGYARVAYGLTLTYARQNFVLAAEAIGARPLRVLWQEVMPNVIVPVASFGALGAGIAIIAEGGLSFLGLGAQGTISWGGMIASGQQQIYDAPQAALAPMAVMFLTIVALNLVGERLGATLDPREGQL